LGCENTERSNLNPVKAGHLGMSWYSLFDQITISDGVKLADNPLLSHLLDVRESGTVRRDFLRGRGHKREENKVCCPHSGVE
jgi:hypothetical protein